MRGKRPAHLDASNHALETGDTKPFQGKKMQARQGSRVLPHRSHKTEALGRYAGVWAKRQIEVGLRESGRSRNPICSWNLISLAVVILLVAIPSAAAAQLEGVIINETTKKRSPGDQVTLLSLSQEGMAESAHCQTDNAGRFRLSVPDPKVTHVVRVTHQGVTYHQVLEPGTARVAVAVYDVANRVEGVTAVMDVQRFEATNATLEVKQLITVRNDSRPPRTLMNDRPFEIQLPPDAQVQSGLVQVEEGPPLMQRPIAEDRNGHYYFNFPIRPGDTRFAVVYRLPYNGTAIIEPRLRNPVEKFVVMLPKSMKFTPGTDGIFHAMPNTTPDDVEGTDAVKSELSLSFRISGMGMLEELKGRRQDVRDIKVASSASTNSPGGGLAPPIEAPDPLEKYRWPILVGFAVLTVAGAMYATQRKGVSRTTRDPVLIQKVRKEVRQRQSRARARRSNRQRVHL